jgi:hypothetical protein
MMDPSRTIEGPGPKQPLYASLLAAVAVVLSITACSRAPDAQSIVDAAIETHGGARYQSSVIEFDFRDKHFSIMRDGGLFSFKRTFRDSTGTIEDVLSNDGFVRKIDGVTAPLSGKETRRFSSSVNSVVYFALLPAPLNDSAAIKKYLGETTITGEAYHTIEVTFRQEGGGKDHENLFVYWLRRQDFTMDYLAYRFGPEPEATRFRQAFNPRTINGIQFADYHNYKGLPETASLLDYTRFFEASELAHVSDVVLKNVRVESLSN